MTHIVAPGPAARRQDFPESWRFDGKPLTWQAPSPRATVDRMSRLAMIAVLAAAVAAVLLNVVLLNRASSGNDPVGKLGPIAHLPAQGLRPAPAGRHPALDGPGPGGRQGRLGGS